MQVRDLPGVVRLKIRTKILSVFLRSHGINCTVNAHFRSRKTAHRWSTVYQIASGRITLGDLRRLKDGKDLDGNLWYCKAWDNLQSDDAPANTVPEILTNAMSMGPTKAVFAAEGYESGDIRRLPNLKDVPVSRHISGAAIDLNVDWAALHGAWSEESNSLIKRFGLRRPIAEESWHVEIDESGRADFTFSQGMKWWFLSQWTKHIRNGSREIQKSQ